MQLDCLPPFSRRCSGLARYFGLSRCSTLSHWVVPIGVKVLDAVKDYIYFGSRQPRGRPINGRGQAHLVRVRPALFVDAAE